MPSDELRAAQALSILQTLERLQPGQCVTISREPGDFTATLLDRRSGAVHRGTSATDALGQLTCVLALEGSV